MFHPAERTPLGVFPGQFRLPPNPDAEPVTDDGLPGLIRNDFWQMGLVVDGTEDDWPGASRRGVHTDPARRARFEVAERAVAAARAEAAAARPRADTDSTADSMPPLLYCGGDGTNNDMDAEEEEEDAEIELMN